MHPSPCCASNIHKLFRQLSRCILLSVFLVKFYTILSCSRNLICLFLILSASDFHSHFSYSFLVLSIILSLSCCRITSLLLQVPYASLRNISRMLWLLGDMILCHCSAVISFSDSGEIYLISNNFFFAFILNWDLYLIYGGIFVPLPMARDIV